MYFNKLSWLFKRIYPRYTWKKETPERNIYLTFDDGPVPGVTELVLKILRENKVKATFFCVGDNVRKYPQLFRKILSEGHSVGNHTYHHVDGWKLPPREYLQEVNDCYEVMSDAGNPESWQKGKRLLFRPPYGKIQGKAAEKLLEDYEIIMWDVLTGDFDKKLSEKNCLKKSIRYTTPGSIVIFHDSYKAEKNLKFVLPQFLKHFLSEGFLFKRL